MKNNIMKNKKEKWRTIKEHNKNKNNNM